MPPDSAGAGTPSPADRVTVLTLVLVSACVVAFASTDITSTRLLFQGLAALSVFSLRCWSLGGRVPPPPSRSSA